MPDPTIDKPIVVGTSTLPTTLAAALRYGISLLGTFLVARGYVDADNVDGILTMLVTIATVAYGLFKTRQNRAKLIITAGASPNKVAVVE